MREVVLVGNPNAGKTTLFNRLTGEKAKVGNWHGVTVEVRRAMAKGEETIIYDLPGLYTLSGGSMEEKRSSEFLRERPSAEIVFVAECRLLPRVVELFFAVTKGRRACLVLTKRRAFEKRGGGVDKEKLSLHFGVPVYFAEELNAVPVCGTVGEDHATGYDFYDESVLREVEISIDKPTTEGVPTIKTQRRGDPTLRLATTRATPIEGYVPENRGVSPFEKLLERGYICVPLFMLVTVGSFYFIFAPNTVGTWFKSIVEDFFSITLYGLAMRIPSPVVKSLVGDGILKSVGSVVGFMPQITLLYLLFTLLEESGLFSYLAFHTDPFFQAVGLSGRAVFSLFLGFGCSALAIQTTAGLENTKLQRRAIFALAYLPCSAKIPVFVVLTGALFENAFLGIVLLYGLGVGLCILSAVLMKEEEKTELIMELAPLQIPSFQFVLKSLCFQIKQFIIKTSTVILAFLLATWLLSSFNFSFELCTVEESMLAKICGLLGGVFAPIGCGDWKVTYSALSGLVAKENVAGLLELFYGGFPFSERSAFAFAVFMLACSPCVTAVAMTARQVGRGRALIYATVQTVSALLLSYFTYFLLTQTLTALTLFPVVMAIFILRYHIETVRRPRGHHLKKVHRRDLSAGVLRLPHSLKGTGDKSQR